MNPIRTIVPCAVALLLVSSSALALIPGGGKASRDCWLEFEVGDLALNFPAAPKKSRELRCFDGEAGCDLDGATNGSCTFAIDVCLYNDDASLPGCTPSDVTAALVSNKKNDPGLASLQAAIDALLPASSNVCTSGETIDVPTKVSGGGKEKRGKAKVKIKTETATGKTAEKLKLACIPREWPSHGYDHRNTRATAKETTLTPASVAGLQELWDVPLSGAVTGTPAVAGGRVYAASWDGFVYSIDARSGKVKWKYDTGSTGVSPPGVKGSATVTADGRVLVGDAKADVHCLDAKNGKLLWKTTVGDPSVDDFWSSPAVANGRVYMGLASHLDVPCTRGQMAALDLDDGSLLWSTFMVPEKVCDNDTSVTCTSDADCGLGTCVGGLGAGVTATVAVDPSGDFIYMNTVGCFTYHSIGHSDSMLKLDAETGAIVWASRLNQPEQFGACSADPSIDCGDASACPGGTCDTKSVYHDFGFLNGPLLVDADDGQGGTRTLVVSGSKDGSLYALDPSGGSLIWQNAVLPAPVTPGFAGFGLFDAAVGFADGRFHAALYQFAPATVPAPEHLQAFSAVDGSTVWTEEIGISWGSVALAGGVVWSGTQASTALLAHDAATGAPLVTLTMPANVSSGPAIVDGVLYTGYGVLGSGGVRAYALP